MKTFDLTEHVLQRHQCDFFYYYMISEPANNNGGEIIEVNFGG